MNPKVAKKKISEGKISVHTSQKEEIPSKDELEKIEETEDSLSEYSYPKEFLKLELNKIREFIEILEEHYQNLLEQENIVLAKSAKQRLILLKNLEKEKMKNEANIIYSNQRELVEDKMKEELNSYNEKTKNELDSINQAFGNQEVELLEEQRKELEEFVTNFEKNNENKKPKPSKALLNWMRIRDYCLKLNKFEKAEEANKEIEKLSEKEQEKFEKENKQKFTNEINKMVKRHEQEKKNLQMKKNSIIEMFNQAKNRNIDQIKKKYEAKMKELKNYQNFEMANFDKITKGIAKPCTRIQSIVGSTKGVQEEEKNEKKENVNENANENNGNEKEKEIEENKNEGEGEGEKEIEEGEGENNNEEGEGEGEKEMIEGEGEGENNNDIEQGKEENEF